MAEREDSWGRLHEAVLARWTVAIGSYDPDRHRWSVSAVGPDRGRSAKPVEGRNDNAWPEHREHLADVRLAGDVADGELGRAELRVELAGPPCERVHEL